MRINDWLLADQISEFILKLAKTYRFARNDRRCRRR